MREKRLSFRIPTPRPGHFHSPRKKMLAHSPFCVDDCMSDDCDNCPLSNKRYNKIKPNEDQDYE